VRLEKMKIMLDGRIKDMKSVWYDSSKNQVSYIDQRALPFDFIIYRASTLRENTTAIMDMVVRGAPAIGISGAWALCQAKKNGEDLEEAAELIRDTRPTARDLFYAIEKVLEAEKNGKDIKKFCCKLEEDIISRCRRIGENGEKLIHEGCSILTHCNAGALATVDWGTAIAPMRMAFYAGKKFMVYVDETRPRLQGSRLTAWELGMEGIAHMVIADNAAGYLMSRGKIDLVITGADRITSKGYVANKIGTYEKAVLARVNEIPFYVAAPRSTFDFSIEQGLEIPIEIRDESEITFLGEQRVAAEGSPAYNPAFDVTPPEYITGFITEQGILDVGEIEMMREG
jgi:translation initiation factor eIF-2B subunit alpha/methylthioribose-1-phosphate isomerase